MSKPDPSDNPAERGPETRTDEKHGKVKRSQLQGNQRPDRDLARGSEGETRRASGPR